MKKFILAFLFLVFIIPTAFAAKPDDAPKGKKMAGACTTIQDGVLTYSTTSDLLMIGYDQWGYNYQAHLFNGYYDNSGRPTPPVSEGDWLQMKWNDAWLSNKDCDNDGLLDLHYPYDSYIGSGAWLTNHQSGEYVGTEGEVCKWNYFVKIVAVPDDAKMMGGDWVSTDGVIIGPAIWGAFAITQEVENDACANIHGLQHKSPLNSGLGYFKP